MNRQNLYYTNPYMKEFEATVLSCTENNGSFEIILENTCFYPEGGGQPSDTGYIGDSFISYVFEKNNCIIHLADKALAPQKTYFAEIDWNKRFEHMQHHSAEHIVSGVIYKLFGGNNVGFNIGLDYVTIDFDVEFASDDLEKIEYFSNKAIYKNIPINISYYENTPSINYRSKKELQGPIRIVTIDDYDICACCGTQLERTGEIGLIKIISSMKYKSGSRLFMLCGLKALKDYNIKQKNAGEISTLLSAKPNEILDYVNKLYHEKEDLKHKLNIAQNKLIDIKIASYSKMDKLILFEENLTPTQMRRLINGLIEKINFIAIFTENSDKGYKYMISSKNIDITNLVKTMNQSLSGKGGGKGIVQGFLESTRKDIEEFLSNQKEINYYAS